MDRIKTYTYIPESGISYDSYRENGITWHKFIARNYLGQLICEGKSDGSKEAAWTKLEEQLELMKIKITKS